MSLLRRVIGGVLRRLRLRQGRTLREVAQAAGVSVPYLSEVERGRKEASSEVLAAICRALGIHLSELLEEARDDLRQVEPRVPVAPRGLTTLEPVPASRRDGGPTLPLGPRTPRAMLHRGPGANGPTLRVDRFGPRPAGRPGPRTVRLLGCPRTRTGPRRLTTV